jgi:ankyrin repeat protein
MMSHLKPVRKSMMSMHVLFARLYPLRFIHHATVLTVTLAWCSVAFCGEIDDAAASGDLAKVKVLLKDNANLVFSKDEIGRTPLHAAAVRGRKDVAELLLANKADVNAKDSNGSTPLHAAAFKGYEDVAKLLLAHGADVGARDKLGSTPLHSAAYEGYDLDFKRDSVSLTAGSSPSGVVKVLLANHADVTAKDNNGDTPLHEAAAPGHTGVVKLLLAAKAEVNAKDNDGYTPLHNAALWGHKDTVEVLLLNGADVNAKGNEADTPLDRAKAGKDNNDSKAKDWEKNKEYEAVEELLLHPPTPMTLVLTGVGQFITSHYITLLCVVGGMVILGILYFRSRSGRKLNGGAA